MRRDVAGSLAAALRRGLGHWSVRLLLTLAIISSLVPAVADRELDGLFLLLFVPEFLCRLFVLFREEGRERGLDGGVGMGWRVPRRGEVALQVLDAVALLAFLPPAWLLGGVASARTLRLFRLVRLLLLLRIWASMAGDLYTVLSRAERLRQIGLMVLATLVLSFAGAVVIEQFVVDGGDFDGDGVRGDPDDRSFMVRAWWSFRQIEDPGNLLENPSETGLLVVSALLTVFGLFLVSFLIGLGTDVVRELMTLSQLRPPGLSGHTVVLNITPATRQLLVELLRHYEKLAPEGLSLGSLEGLREVAAALRRRRQFLVVGKPATPPDFMREPEFARVVYRQAPDDEEAASIIERADLRRAKRIVMLADLHEPEPDDATIRTMLNVVVSMQTERDELPRPRLIAEVIDDSSVGAARRAAASWRRADPQGVLTQVVTTENLVALFLACAVRWPAAERVLLELLTSDGWEIYSYAFDYPVAGGWSAATTTRLSDEACVGLASRLSDVTGQTPESPIHLGFLLVPEVARDEGPASQLAPHFGPTVPPGRTAAGLIMLAPNFRKVREAVARAAREPSRRGADGRDSSEVAAASPRRLSGRLRPGETTSVERVLVCGYRSGSVDLVESLAVAYPTATILFLVGREGEELQRAQDAFEAHRAAVLRGEGRPREGAFEVQPGDGTTLRYRRRGEALGATVHLERAEWSSSRTLSELPRGFGPAVDVDALVLSADDTSGGDARTLAALMKLESLSAQTRAFAGGPATRGLLAGQRVVVEVLDEHLATRLRERFSVLQSGDHSNPGAVDGGSTARLAVSVFALPALRAYFMFQSVVVPHFDPIFQELLGPWGKSLVPLELHREGLAGGEVTFGDLAEEVAAQGGRMVGFEAVTEEGRLEAWLGREPEDGARRWKSHQVRRVWALMDDGAREGDRPGTPSAPPDA